MFAGCLDYTEYFGVLTNYGDFLFLPSILHIKEPTVYCIYCVPCTIIGKDIISKGPDGLELIFWRMGCGDR